MLRFQKMVTGRFLTLGISDSVFDWIMTRELSKFTFSTICAFLSSRYSMSGYNLKIVLNITLALCNFFALSYNSTVINSNNSMHEKSCLSFADSTLESNTSNTPVQYQCVVGNA